MKHWKFFLRIFFSTFVCLYVCGTLFTTNIKANVSHPNNLNNRIFSLLKDPSLGKISCGVSVRSIKKNISLFNYRDTDLFCVASNMKLFTTAAALVYLGPDFEYITSIGTNGIINASGKLEGDVIIRGSGDPNLSGRFYNGNIPAVPELWTNAFQRMGIDKVTGDIIADDRIFDRVYTNPNWPENQLSEWYCAPSCGISFNDNCVDITLVPDKKSGKVTKLLIEPNTSYFTIFNDCIYTTNKKEHAYSIYRKPETNQIFIKGKFWVNASPEKRWITVHNPALYLATVFKETLEKNGITVDGSVRLIDEKNLDNTKWKEITRTTSTMEQTVFITNKRSQNFYAEQIMKTLGIQIKGRGTLKAGIEVLEDFIGKLDFDPHEYLIEDGSGLSKGNRLSPKIITSLLVYMNKHPYGKIFYDSLPISGSDGGLQHRMTSPRYKNRVHAKTGYIAKTSALSGYIETQNGDTLAFSVLMNNFKNLSTAQKIQDNICQTLMDFYN